jgi:carbamoyltransferase
LNDILVLGITDGHNAGACLLKNGKIEYAISEERISRNKNEAGYPKLAIEKILRLSNIKIEEIHTVALAGKFSHEKKFYSNWDWYKVGFENQLEDSEKPKVVNFEEQLKNRKESIVKHLGINEKKIIVVEHHLSHAASAYLASSWINNEEILVLTCDGSGDGISATVNIGQNGKIRRIAKTENNASLGKIYSRITLLLGMKPWEHEYKIMGLAPYADEAGVAKSKKILDELLEVKESSLEFNMKSKLSMNYCYNFLKTRLENHRFDWIAGGVQQLTEELLKKWVINALKKTGCRKIVCAGGVFMNVKANMHLSELELIDDIFIFPSGGDESLAMGSAMYAYSEILEEIGQKIHLEPLGPIYLGMEFSDLEIENEIKENQLQKGFSIEFSKDIEKQSAELLSQGEIVARFKDRMEWGARSLGNRSILADPSSFEKVRDINLAIKQRDFWMPFAPTIISEKQEEYIENPKKLKAPYMVMGFHTKERAYKELSSAIHSYDFTARPQLLEKNYNPSYYDLINNFEKHTGIPALLNTSFNLHGYPIVCTPTDAINTLKKSGLKYLAIGNYLISKN